MRTSHCRSILPNNTYKLKIFSEIKRSWSVRSKKWKIDLWNICRSYIYFQYLQLLTAVSILSWGWRSNSKPYKVEYHRVRKKNVLKKLVKYERKKKVQKVGKKLKRTYIIRVFIIQKVTLISCTHPYVKRGSKMPQKYELSI